MRHIDEIIVHCTATRPTWWADKTGQEQVDEIRRWHTTPPRNWSDIGYHYLITRQGEVIKGRPDSKIGAHVKGHNTGTLGVSLFGGHGSSSTDRFEDHFTRAQDRALRRLLSDLQVKHPGIKKITGHNQYASKACPGFSVPEWLAQADEAKPAPTQPKKQGGALARLLAALWAIISGLIGGKR